MAANRHRRPQKPPLSQPRPTLGAVGLTGLGIGGIVGAGFFLGSGIIIRQVGPAIVFTYVLGGVVLAQVMGAITSLAVNVPVRTSYQEYIHRYLGSFFGFLLGWAVFISSVLAIGSEATAMAVYSRTWVPSVPMGAFAVFYTLAIIALNLFGVSNLGKTEAAMSLVKSAVLVAFILVAGLVAIRILPHTHVFGIALLNRSGGVFPRGVGAVFKGMLIVIFSYAGVTTVAMAASRTKDPKRTIPRAAVFTAVGVALLYVLSVSALVLLVRYTSFSPRQSPFVTALAQYHFVWFASIFNGVILIASFSVMAGTFYAAEWMLISIAAQKGAPKVFARSITGRPVPALAATAVMVLATVALAFVLPSSAYTDLTAASSYFSFTNWLLILLAFAVWHLRARRPDQAVSRLAFGAPYGAVVMAAAIVALGVYSVGVRSFRPGFYVFAAATILIGLGWMVSGRRAE